MDPALSCGSLLALVGLVLLLPLLLSVAPAMRWLWPALHRLPMLGPLLRCEALGEVCPADGCVVGSAGGAARCLAADGRRAARRQPCPGLPRVADEVDNGRALDESMADRRQFPASLIPVVHWGQQAAALPDAFRAAATMFEGRARSHGTLLEAMLLPMMFLAILVMVGIVVFALFLPLLSLINTLSGF